MAIYLNNNVGVKLATAAAPTVPSVDISAFVTNAVINKIVDELITCITKEQQVQALDGKHFTEAAFDNSLPHWQIFNGKAIEHNKPKLPKINPYTSEVERDCSRCCSTEPGQRYLL